MTLEAANTKISPARCGERLWTAPGPGRNCASASVAAAARDPKAVSSRALVSKGPASRGGRVGRPQGRGLNPSPCPGRAPTSPWRSSGRAPPGWLPLPHHLPSPPPGPGLNNERLGGGGAGPGAGRARAAGAQAKHTAQSAIHLLGPQAVRCSQPPPRPGPAQLPTPAQRSRCWGHLEPPGASTAAG